ncbi:HK97 family phage prohead protease (plasmid) [Pseudorhodobacter turbinis]|uniref:HK97 family phage prohead protease n=1 Tax=Pseudorhodobacter turbinis TaxID=2500533 RepID=A0A4P8EKB5_9RHOB|nr:HK97 family phage prohead protease [Pseudorhodobacter turbinis]QCO57458.1 HK97 family phage prohead protease [Pseudorhodobacter turbinis]
MNLITKSIDLEVAESTDGKISAYLTTFGNSDFVGDIMTEKCLDEFIENFDPANQKLHMLYEHDTKMVIGEWETLTKDETGVIGNGIIYTETSLGKDVQALMKRNAVGSVSIGFQSKDFVKNTSGGRTFNSIQLVETSVVLKPANPQAKILSVKSEDGLIETKALKTLLREAGMARSEIEALFNGGFTGLKNLRETESNCENILATLKSFKL